MSYIIGVDIGGTKIAAGLVWRNRVPKHIKIPTQAHSGKNKIIQNIIKSIKVFDNSKVSAIGVGIAGAIDQKRGVVFESHNMPSTFKNIQLKKILQKTFKKSVSIDNDANCFTLAESVYGAGKKYDVVIGLTLGTGIGGGIVYNKKIYRGSKGLAGELGHMTIVEKGYPCGCGKHGHLESYASGTAMAKLYHRFSGRKKTAIEVEELAKKKDKMALLTIKTMSEALGIGFANIAHIFDPDLIVLGGGLAHVQMIWRPALQIAKNEVIYTPLKKIKVAQAELGSGAAILGAALITLEKK